MCVLHFEVEGDPRGHTDEKKLQGSRRRGVYSTPGAVSTLHALRRVPCAVSLTTRMGCNLCTLQKREEHYKLLYEIAQVSTQTWWRRVGKAGWLDGETELLLQPWVPLSIKVSGASYSSSSEGDVRARSAAFPMPAPGEFLTSPSAYDCPGAVRVHTANVFFCSSLLPARAGLDFPLHASPDPINLRTAFP